MRWKRLEKKVDTKFSVYAATTRVTGFLGGPETGTNLRVKRGAPVDGFLDLSDILVEPVGEQEGVSDPRGLFRLQESG